jgi:Flp pilus assembly protein TadG
MKQRTSSSKGAALIEFAGSLILLSTMFAGMFQAGYSFYAYNSLVNAVRSGARYASRQQPASAAVNPEFVKAVQNLVVYGEPAPAANAKPVVAGLTPVSVEIVLGQTTATVRLRGFEIDALFSKIKLDGRPSVTFPLTAGVAQ